MTHVTKETAQLLKEKGFDLPCEVFYNTDCYGKEFGKHIDYNKLPIRSGILCSCPDIYTACAWLRETKGVHVFAVPCYGRNRWFYRTYQVADNAEFWYLKMWDMLDFATHDLALEAGIIHALKHYVK